MVPLAKALYTPAKIHSCAKHVFEGKFLCGSVSVYSIPWKALERNVAQHALRSGMSAIQAGWRSCSLSYCALQ